MRFKDDFLKELLRRLKENIDIIESSFSLIDVELVKSRLYDFEPLEFHLSILLEDDPYLFLNKLIYSVVNRQDIKVSSTNIATAIFETIKLFRFPNFCIKRVHGIWNISLNKG